MLIKKILNYYKIKKEYKTTKKHQTTSNEMHFIKLADSQNHPQVYIIKKSQSSGHA